MHISSLIFRHAVAVDGVPDPPGGCSRAASSVAWAASRCAKKTAAAAAARSGSGGAAASDPLMRAFLRRHCCTGGRPPESRVLWQRSFPNCHTTTTLRRAALRQTTYPNILPPSDPYITSISKGQDSNSVHAHPTSYTDPSLGDIYSPFCCYVYHLFLSLFLYLFITRHLERRKREQIISF